MSNNGFPSMNSGFPQVPQQGFPQAKEGSTPQGVSSPYGFSQQRKHNEQDAQQDTKQDTKQGAPGFGSDTTAPSLSQPGYSQRKSLFPQDDQATTVLPPMQQMVNTSNTGSWSGQQQPAAYQPTYQAELPVHPKEGILYKNTGRNLEEIPDQTPIILDTAGGKMTLTLDTISIYRLGDVAKRHKNYYVELPLKSLSSASVVSDTDKDGNVISAICLDVVTVEGHNRVPATASEALKDVWSCEVANLDEAKSFCAKVNARINNERFPVRDMPHIDEGPRNTVIAAVVAGILAVALVVVCFTGRPYSKPSYELSPAEVSRIQQKAMDKAQKEAEAKVAADQAKKQEEQAKKDQEAQQKQAEQQNQQQSAERDAAQQMARRILATDTLSKQGLINKMVAQGITQDLAQSTADGLTDVNWSNNATDLARKYLQAHPDWTSDQLNSQLVNNDLFTQDEANAATSALAGDIAKNQSSMQTQSNGQNGTQSNTQSGNSDSVKGKGKHILDGITNLLNGSDNK